MSHEEREYRSAPVLTKDAVALLRSNAEAAVNDVDSAEAFRLFCDSHEALRAERDALKINERVAEGIIEAACTERDAALAEVARMRPVVEAAVAQARKAESVTYTLREPLGSNFDYIMFTHQTNEAVRAAKEVQP